jgi:hypothetical protein
MAAQPGAAESAEADGAPGNSGETPPRSDRLSSVGPRTKAAPSAGTPQQWRETVSAPRPALQTAAVPATLLSSRPGGIAWWLWVLLAGSLVFFAVTRMFVRHENARLYGAPDAVPFLQISGPTDPVRAGALDLTWGDVPGATGYRLSIAAITGEIVVDALPVDGTEWIPPDDALPALVRGEYRWTVEALDEKGTVLAKSAEGGFRVM